MNRTPVLNDEDRKTYNAPTTDVEANTAGSVKPKPAKPAPVVQAPSVP